MSLPTNSSPFDDARLTAYVLGELNESDRSAFEIELNSNPALQTELEAMQSISGDLQAVLGQAVIGRAVSGTSGESLGQLQRASVLNEATVAEEATPRTTNPWSWVPMAAAAMMLFMVGAVAMLASKQQSSVSREEARQQGVYFSVNDGDVEGRVLDSMKLDEFREVDRALKSSKKGGAVMHDDSTEVTEQEVVTEEPLIEDESLADHPETDNDLPYQESFGETTGTAPAPFNGPSTNGVIGVSGGSGGAFQGRGAGRAPAADRRIPTATRPVGKAAPNPHINSGPMPATTPAPGSSPLPLGPTTPPVSPSPMFRRGPGSGSGKAASPVAGTIVLDPRSQPVESTVSTRVLSRPVSARTETIPAEYRTIQERVRLADGTYGTRERQVLVRPASTRQIPIPAQYMTIQDRVKVQRGLHGGLFVVARLQSVDGKQVWVQLPTPVPHSLAGEAPGTEQYDPIPESPFVDAKTHHTSTFSVDVDTASYANMRRFLSSGRLPPHHALRLEELINYFDYGYDAPTAKDKHPFNTHVQIVTCPWNPRHRLARIALKGREIDRKARPASNLVFLVDVSGSMAAANKLGLVKKSLTMLVEQLDERDRIAIVTYASSSGVALASTPCNEQGKIMAAINALSAGGSTNGEAGIKTAYETAKAHFIKGGTNRVVLVTDGDFNVGTTDNDELTALINRNANEKKIFLSILGYGMGNYQDGRMEALSNKGQGNYAYIDSVDEARRVLVEKLTGTLLTIAKDVKVQVFFNPQKVASYRLIGYQNRALAAADFNNDRKDAGDVGAGHEVTALYELVPVGTPPPSPEVDPNPFVNAPKQDATTPVKAEKDDAPARPESFRLRLRYKLPESDTSVLMEQDVADQGLTFDKADRACQWAASVALFGQVLRGSRHVGSGALDAVLETASALAEDADTLYEVAPEDESLRGKGAELNQFVELVKRAKQLGAGSR